MLKLFESVERTRYMHTLDRFMIIMAYWVLYIYMYVLHNRGNIYFPGHPTTLKSITTCTYTVTVLSLLPTAIFVSTAHSYLASMYINDHCKKKRPH